VAFVDAAMPGMLPVVNEFCIEQAVRTGLGLKAQINLRSAFDRKNYFYPDLPQGYQISQLYHPLVGEGEVLVELGAASRAVCGLNVSMSNRMRANPFMTWTRTCRLWISTAPASR
jgi:Asp-tRNA(Asn)/Glu-tRNA(Gln) amidotransferase B subunit